MVIYAIVVKKYLFIAFTCFWSHIKMITILIYQKCLTVSLTHYSLMMLFDDKDICQQWFR